MRPIRLALFDMDDVVYAYSRPDRIAHLSSVTGLDPAFINERIWGEGLEAAADGGAFPTPELYIASWRDRLGYPLAIDDWVEARRLGMRLIPGTLALIERLLAEGMAVGVLTNNGPLVHAYRETLAPDLARLVGDRFLVSSAFSTMKPDPRVFQRALDRLGFRPEESFFTDDMPENVEGARTAGLAAAVFTTPSALEAALVAYGLLSDVSVEMTRT
ncbi:hydrolase [Pleomorphomonas diazotrophica]|uniref:Hydrolase n=1 Tax=Pleomorphomonas diazotrophica TaxID=1166257 RepID=A0A1I4TTH9_9HYPH|nr:HAD family phosphatase [Pleomorphomonas diazotrophica]PKR87674.1 hydrolase [Pleomorphomonas diazotrophica]SFM80034.1 putative hydrolase of the HAD superfamily [Pleomorphomonas diazotrophica]